MTYKILFDTSWPTRRDPETPDPRLVGQADRTWLIPLVHSTLASPEVEHHWPRYDKVTALSDACAYWEAAYYLLAVVLGWSDVGLGLKRLYEGEGRGVDSPYLDLLQQVWNDRGQLDHFALWAWHRGVVLRGDAQPDRAPEDFLGEEWYRDFLARHPRYGVSYDHDPYHGGTNPLHLGHCLGAMHGEASGTLLLGSPEERRAVLLLDHARGWYAALERARVPEPEDDRSWHVEVVVRPLGWLGRFRKSRESGRWFAGRHAVHKLGFR